MRSLAAEWLVVPLFLLPLLTGAGLCVWARDAHERALAPYRERGAEQARRWLAEPDGAAAWLPARMRRLIARAVSEQPGIPFELPSTSGRVLFNAPDLGAGAWTLADALPVGLPPAALADPATRLAIQTGQAPVDVGRADPTARALRDLLGTPDLEALRTAPLPASMKRYVLAGWLRRGAGGPALLDAQRLLALLSRLQDALADRGGPLTPGAHQLAGLDVISTGVGDRPLVVVPAGTLAEREVQATNDSGSVQLTWTFPPPPREAGDTLWSGRLEAPLAGHFAFVAPGGTAWWRTPNTQRWAGPGLTLLLAFLLLPVLLLVTMRRRRRLDEARLRFLNEMAHDLRTPLTALRLHVDMLAQAKGDPDRREAYLGILARETGRLSALVGGLLDLSRLEGGQRVFRLERLAIRAVAEQAAADFRALYPARAEDLVLEGPAEMDVLGDRPALDRCLANLLDNAGKFSPAGTPVRVAWEAAGDAVRLRVADAGPGIPRTERRRIFVRYARGKAAQRDGVPGTGLGLALVRELLAGMHATVDLLDDPPGATFEIRLPGARDG